LLWVSMLLLLLLFRYCHVVVVVSTFEAQDACQFAALLVASTSEAQDAC
jgi:hypothetical protein